MYKVEPKDTVAEPPQQPQNNPDSPSPGQAPAPKVQTRISLAVTPAPAAGASPSTTEIAPAPELEQHDDLFPSQATAQHLQQLQRESEHHNHQLQLHHHVEGSMSASAPAHDNQKKNRLEAANIAHFDALGHDFDKQNPFSAEFADRLFRALRRRFSRNHSTSAGAGGSGGDDNNNVVVLDEDATSVLDYACGSGTCFTPLFRVGMVFR